MGKFIASLVCLMFVCIQAYATDIYCAKCQKHLYTTKEDVKKLIEDNKTLMISDVTVEEGVPQPKETDGFVCPFDQAPLNGYEFWFWDKHRELPNMAYPAITIYTKDENGNFIWYPDAVDLHDTFGEQNP